MGEGLEWYFIPRAPLGEETMYHGALVRDFYLAQEPFHEFASTTIKHIR